MNILIIHNIYSRQGGEEGVVETQRKLFERAGNNVVCYFRDYKEIEKWRFGKLSSFFSALYNRRSKKDLQRLVSKQKFDVAIIHNFFPVVSPSILKVLHKRGIKTVMTLHNFRLVCPNGLFFNKGKICEKCINSSLREWNCFFNKCEGSYLGSFAYALRSRMARGKFLKYVDMFVAQTQFQLDKLSILGIKATKKAIIPNCLDIESMPRVSDNQTADRRTKYIAFSGRLSKEKGVELLIDLARNTPEIEYRVAGEWGEGLEDLKIGVPTNLKLMGFLSKPELALLYQNSVAVVSTSICYESLPLSVLEAMYYGALVVVPNYPSMQEIAENGNCGVLFTPNDLPTLQEHICRVWDCSEEYKEIAQSGQKRVLDTFSPQKYVSMYERLF